jgi:hypothetical protein
MTKFRAGPPSPLYSSISVSAESAPMRMNSETASARPRTEVLAPRAKASALTLRFSREETKVCQIHLGPILRLKIFFAEKMGVSCSKYCYLVYENIRSMTLICKKTQFYSDKNWRDSPKILIVIFTPASHGHQRDAMLCFGRPSCMYLPGPIFQIRWVPAPR